MSSSALKGYFYSNKNMGNVLYLPTYLASPRLFIMGSQVSFSVSWSAALLLLKCVSVCLSSFSFSLCSEKIFLLDTEFSVNTSLSPFSECHSVVCWRPRPLCVVCLCRSPSDSAMGAHPFLPGRCLLSPHRSQDAISLLFFQPFFFFFLSVCFNFG